MLVHRLLSGLAAEELVVVTERGLRTAVSARKGRVLPGSYHYVAHKGLRGNRFAVGRVINAALNLVLAVAAGIRTARLVRRHRAAWVLSVADDGFSQIAGAIAGTISRRPHLLMIFDLWAENAYTEVERALARVAEPLLFRHAAAILVHCREMAEHYRAKHGIECVVLPTPVEPWQPERSRSDERGESEVLFAGAVYWAQEDSLRRLTTALRDVPGVGVTIVGSWSDERALLGRGIVADRLEPDLAPSDFRRRLERADILFLGLGFETGHPDVIRTASPAKLPEYMMSGRPILIHAPAGSHVAEYARAGDFAEIVDVADETALRTAVERILADGRRTSDRAERARRLALERHDVARVRARFAATLESCRS